MAFWDIVKRPVASLVYEPRVTEIGGTDGTAERVTAAVAAILSRQGLTVEDLGRMSPSRLWATQPNLRTVIAFIARNIAQLTLNVFAETDEDERDKDKTCRAARALRDPGDGKTTYDLIYALIGDVLLYDRAYWLIWFDKDGNDRIRRLPPAWVTVNRANAFTIASYTVADGPNTVDLPPDQIIDFTGYAPADPLACSPTIDALRTTLQEQIEATAYRLATWKRGGRVSAVLQRPADAPDWSDNAREAFREDWYSTYTGNGPRAGGTPILEDGMTLNRIDFNAQEQQFVDAAKLAMTTVASAFHINPTMVGQLDNANYSNTREFRRMLYGDSLGPVMRQITDRINLDLFRILDDGDGVARHAEFDVADRTQGSFEEQIVAMQAAVGRPFVTADEARARLHMKPLGDGADELVTPLNVVTGGQASPQDSGSQNIAPGGESARAITGRKDGGVSIKATPSADHQEAVERAVKAFLRRQGGAVMSAIGAGKADWWNADRWDAELAHDLTKVGETVATSIGKAAARKAGFPDGYNPPQTVKFLETVMARKAGRINAATKDAVTAALDDPNDDPGSVFADDRTDSRAKGLAVGVTTFVAGFAVHEAASQIAYRTGKSPTKTWETGPNPRQSHAAMDGETVGIDEPFSNGCMWPADGPDVDEVAGCNCSVSINF